GGVLDGDGRREGVYGVGVGLVHLLEELASVRRQRLDVAALPFRVEGVEGERRLSRAREPRDDDELLARDLDVDALQIVPAGAADDDAARHECARPCYRAISWRAAATALSSTAR